MEVDLFNIDIIYNMEELNTLKSNYGRYNIRARW
jgi:hypothetical protein